MAPVSYPGPLRAFARLVPGRSRQQRRTWVGHGRAHIEVRAAHRPGTEDYARRVEEALHQIDGVRWAEVNAVLGRVVVAFDGDQVGVDDLVEVVEGVEEAHDLHREAFPEEQPEHPGDVEPLHRQLFSVGADAAGLGLSVFGKAVRRSAVPAEVASLLSLVDSTPRLRGLLEERVGEATADLLLATSNAVGQGLAQGPLGLIVDATHRMALIGDISARREVWHAREPELHGTPSRAGTRPVAHQPRPVPLPAGPIEHYSDMAALASLVAGLSTFGLTRDQSKVVTALVCGTPKGARLTREVFTSVLGRTLWRRGIVPLDASALGRLDRIDTVVLDAGVLLTGRHVLGALEVTSDAVEPENELRLRASRLLDPDDPRTVRRDRGWTLGPLGKVADASTATRAASRRVRRTGGVILGLLHGRRLVAVLSADPELDGFALPLVTAAAGAGRVLVAGERSGIAERVGAEAALPAGTHLAAAIREEQTAGHVVALVAYEGDAALRAADCGIGVLREDHDPPWGADLLCGPDLDQACRLLDAAAAATAVSHTGTLVALYGSVAAALLALAGPRRGAATRALIGVNGAAAAGMALGAVAGRSLDRRPDPMPASGTAWHALEPEVALARAASTLRGLTGEEARRRSASERGDEEPQEMGLGRAAAEELRNPLTPALATGAAMSAASGAVTDAVLVGSVMGMNALLGGAQRVGASRALRRLRETGAVRVRVLRDGLPVEATADCLVAGDVIDLEAGDTVPADCRLLEADALEADESSLTGESQLVAKQRRPTAAGAVADRSSMVYEGTVVAAGRARALVVARGAETEAARAAFAGVPRPRKTGVGDRLQRLTRAAVPASLGAGFALAGVELLRGRPLRDTVGTGVSLAVAAVPEGLPLVATVAQLAAARRLSGRQALVRNPATIETLGRVDVLCFDKTGTLTEGHVGVGLVTDGDRESRVEELGPPLRSVLAAALRASPTPAEGKAMAHPTDQAVVLAAERAGVALAPADWRLVDDVPFEPGRGYHAALGRTGESDLLSVKGAPEIVLPRCTAWRQGDRVEQIDEDARSALASKVDGLARRGYRVLAVAERSASDRGDLDEERVNRLTFLGLLALTDPVRPEAKEAITGLRRAGIDVIMVTGDHPITAEAIAAELEILNGRGVMTGEQLDRLSDDALADRLADVSVFARVTPSHKVRIVAALRKAGRTVAMTGDGANDAAAIRLADVGVAMGERATDAARQAADLVVTDDRVETIIDAIVEGRSMWISVRDAVSVLVGGNLGEIAFSLGTGLVSRSGSALNARQLLLVNLLTDLLPSLALSVRSPEHHDPEALLVEGPDKSLGAALTRDVAVRAVTTGAAAGGAWAVARGTGTRAHAGTVGLVALVGTQLGQTAVVGWRNPLVLAGSAASAGVLAVAVQTPGVSHFFGCRPLGPLGWSTALTAAGMGTAAAAALSRLLPAPAATTEAALPPSAVPAPQQAEGVDQLRGPGGQGAGAASSPRAKRGPGEPRVPGPRGPAQEEDAVVGIGRQTPKDETRRSR
jgi:cation-transporting ATPase I